MAKSKLVEANEKIAENVVGGYKKIEDGVGSSFTKMTDKFVDQFLTRDGESIEEAKRRLEEEKKQREFEQQEATKSRIASGKAKAHDVANIENCKEVLK